MTDLTRRQIKHAVLRGLKEVAEQFARDPRATDGTIHSAFVASGGRPLRKSKTNAKPAAGRKRG